MRRVRVVWLTALMLVATTLPGSVWAAQSRHTRSRPAVEVTTSGQHSSNRGKNKSKSDKVRIVPINELWDGSSTRATRTAPGPVLLDALLGGHVPQRVSLPSPVLAAVADARGREDFSQTPWLIGHYAHAPPMPL